MSTIHNTAMLISDVELAVRYTYTPGLPERQYMPNGDPGHPAEPAEVEILAVRAGGVEITDLLAQHVLDRIETTLLEMDRDE